MKKKKSNKNFKTCFKCKKRIDESENHISLITYNLGRVISQVDMHMICWGNYNQERCDKRIKEMAGEGMNILSKMGLQV